MIDSDLLEQSEIEPEESSDSEIKTIGDDFDDITEDMSEDDVIDTLPVDEDDSSEDTTVETTDAVGSEGALLDAEPADPERPEPGENDIGDDVEINQEDEIFDSISDKAVDTENTDTTKPDNQVSGSGDADWTAALEDADISLLIPADATPKDKITNIINQIQAIDKNNSVQG
jgi:hypothetical protein